MNTSLNNIWLWVVSTTVFVLFVIALVVWESYQPRASAIPSQPLSDNKKALSIQAPNKDNSGSASSENEPDPSLPAPAKKLQQLINENPISIIDNEELTKRVDSLNKQLDGLNKQLEAQGIDISSIESSEIVDLQTDVNEAEIAKALREIRQFMEEKDIQ